MRHIHILCVATETIYTEVITAFTQYFESKKRRYGHQEFKVTYQYAFQREPHKELFSDDINIVMKAQRFFNPKMLPKKSLKILFQSEQFEKLREFESMPYVENWDLILDVFQDNVDRVSKIAIPKVRFFPIGYSTPAYDMQTHEGGFLEDQHCKLDCYFFGARTKSRVKLWNKCIKPIAPNSRLANQDIGFDKYQNIIHSKINIFMPAWEPYLIPTMHLMQVLANRKFLLVVSDTPQDCFPYMTNRHFVIVPSHSFKDAAKWMLEEEQFRKTFTDVMYRDITTKHRFNDYLDKALKGFM